MWLTGLMRARRRPECKTSPVRALRALLAVAVCCGGTAFLTTDQAAAAGTTVQPGQVVLISDSSQPLPNLPPPADGQPIAGYGFSASVTGEQCAPSVGSGASQIRAASGYDVCVFSLDYTTYPVSNPYITDTGQTVPPVEGHFAFGSQSFGVSSNNLDRAYGHDYAADVTPGSSVTLSISSGGYSQSFSLTAGRPIGVRPAVLYGSVPAGRISLAPVTLSERDLSTGQKASLRVSVASESAGWFLPGDPIVHPSSPNDAYLGIGFNATQEKGPGGAQFTNITEFPGSAVKLLSGGSTVAANEQGGEAIGPFSGTYSFLVPDSLSSALLEIDPGTQGGYQTAPHSSGPDQIAFTGNNPPPTGGGTTTTTTTALNSTPTTVKSHHRSTGGTTKPTGASTTTLLTTGGGSGSKQPKSSATTVASAPASGSTIAGAATGAASTKNTVLSAAKRSGNSSALAAGAAGGTLVIVIPLVLWWRRRRQEKVARELTVAAELPTALPSAGQGAIAEPSPSHNGRGKQSEQGTAVSVAGARTTDVFTVKVMGLTSAGPWAKEPAREWIRNLATILTAKAPAPIDAATLLEAFPENGVPIQLHSLQNRVSELRDAVGPDRVVRRGSAYVITGPVECDWQRFKAYVAEAHRQDTERAERIEQLTAALALVRGRPFEGATPALARAAERLHLVHDIAVAVTNAAHELCTLLIEDDRHEEAERAAYAGLRCEPNAKVLFEDLLVAASHHPVSFEHAWAAIVARNGVDGDMLRLRASLIAKQRARA